MTKQEALEIITNIVQRQNVTKENDLALSIAQKALEKQIPKKPVLQEYDFFDVRLVCPKCKKPIVNLKNQTEYKLNFCHYCGQALDWSDD